MKSFKHGVSRLGRALLAAAALSVLAACGGGTSQIDPFKPTRIISFGDESSVITNDGRKYTVNALDATTGLPVCATNPIWVQTLASAFGLVFSQCLPTGTTTPVTPSGLMYATAGAHVADVAAKIDQHFSSSSFGPKDLVTILVGTNDVLDLYTQFPAQSQATLMAAARERGKQLSDQINRIANANGRVIVSTLPDLGVTPFALKEKANHVDMDRAALISSLSNEFNLGMRLNLINDGRLIGLVLLDETVQAVARYPSAFGYSNVVGPVCLSTVGPLDCTTKTLVADGSGDTWLWATDRLFSPAGQARLGSLALSRASNNPF